jgi:hypothetical protein
MRQDMPKALLNDGVLALENDLAWRNLAFCKGRNSSKLAVVP